MPSLRIAKFRTAMQQMGLMKVLRNPDQRVIDAAVKSARRAPHPSGQDKVSGTGAESAATLTGNLPAFPSALMTTEKLREKVQDALTKAGNKTTQILTESLPQTISTMDHSADQYYQKMQVVVKESRKNYYSRIPFDDRWDDIMCSLAVLGRVSHGNKVTVYAESADAFEAMWNAVDASSSETLWQTYICKDDFVGQLTMKKLVAAHQRGCKTELVYDCGGNISGRGRLTEELTQCGASVIQYRPFFRSLLKYLFRFDWRISPGLRNHRKILLVDEHTGFCGGLNIGNEYCGVRMGGTGKFRDTHCLVEGRAAAHLREVYEDTKKPQPWKYGWKRFRQIATSNLGGSYAGRKHPVSIKMLQSLQMGATQMVRKSGAYVQKTEAETTRMVECIRWSKQREQLLMLMGFYGKAPTSGPLRGMGSPTRLSPCPVRNQIETSNDESLQSCSDTTSPASNDAAGGPSAKVDEVRSVDHPPRGSAENGKRLRTSAMTRRVMAARSLRLYRAMDLPHKRRYTNMLLHMPIADTEPVPEAESYNLRRPSVTQIVSCNPRHRDYSIQYAFWQVTRKCHRRIWVTTPYYLPTRKLFRALTHAAGRGVDVRILAGSNQTTDPWFMWHASKYITEGLLRSGVRVYEYRGTQVMHAKTVVVDSIWSSVGSYNWDCMSNKNLEVCLCHMDVHTARDMEKQFLHDLAMSEEVKLDEHCQRSLWLHFTSWLFYNGVYLLNRITFRSFSSPDIEDSPQSPTS